MGVVVLAMVIFLAAGRLLFWQGLLYLALAVLGTTLSHLLAPSAVETAEQRAKGAEQGEAWDKRLLRVFFLNSTVMFVVAGLDAGRFGWSAAMPLAVTIAGAAAMVAGQLLFALARRQNAFSSSTVHIQRERDHRVCDTGLYRVVRHPGYLGMLLSLLAFPFVLGSYWSLLPAGVNAAVLVLRTMLEDRYLTANLPGYAEYTRRTRWRLLPVVF